MAGRASDEWRRYWTLPLAAALGNSAGVIHTYAMGPFFAPLTREFGWTRAEVSLGLTVALFAGTFLFALVGILIDRWGPRRVGLIGIVIMSAAIALLGTATGSIANWIGLWLLVAVGAAWVQPTIWNSAVASRFDAARGVAIAVTISGSGLAASFLPIFATAIIESYGWRWAFAGIGAVWSFVFLPVIWLFFRGRADKAAPNKPEEAEEEPQDLSGMTYREGLRSAAFWRLSISAFLFSMPITGLLVHLVPVLSDRGISAMDAAWMAGLIGVTSLIGRFGTGFLLDRFTPSRVAAIVFTLPAIAAALLLGGTGTASLTAAVLILGLSIGSELDVVIYLATRYFGLKAFGALFGSLLVAITLGSAFGPTIAGTVFDQFGNYAPFITAIFPLVIVGALMMLTLGPVPQYDRLEKTSQS